MKKLFALIILLLFPAICYADWQSTLSAAFPNAALVDTFDEYADWSANGQFPSGTGDAAAWNTSLAPQYSAGGPGPYGYWNNKAPTFKANITSGSFTRGDAITAPGKAATINTVWVLEDGTYFQLDDYPITGTFAPGDVITGPSGTATMVEWPDIIKDHGASWVWQGTGKSLMMNLGDNSRIYSMAGIGAQRLGVFFGDGVTGKSGYKKIHVFFMIKFRPNFFPMVNSTDYVWTSVFKLFDMCSGFTAVDYFGTAAEHATLTSAPQVTTEYGTDDTVINVGGGGLSTPTRLFFMENSYVSEYKTDLGGWGYTSVVSSRRMSDGPTDFDDLYEAEQWFGVEFISDIGTLGNNDGSMEMYLYNQLGTQLGHWSASEYNKLQHFDHLYNKVTLGGNILNGNTTDSTDLRYYLDDVIIDGDDDVPTTIASTYFSTLASYTTGNDTYCTDADVDGFYVTGSCQSFASDPGGSYRLLSVLTAGGDCDDTDITTNPNSSDPCKDCNIATACVDTETNCSDSIDNDNDTFVDCLDSDCSSDPVCQSPTAGRALMDSNGHCNFDNQGFMSFQ